MAKSITVTAPWLQSPVDIRGIKYIAGEPYFKLCSSDKAVLRMVGNLRARPGFFAMVAQVRNREWAKLIIEASGEVVDGQTELEGPISAKRAKIVNHSLPTTLHINFGEYKMMVLTPGSVGEAVWLNLTTDTVEFLHKKCTSGEDDHHSAQLGCKVIWCTSRKAWRVRWEEDSKNKTKDFKPNVDTDEAKHDAKKSADEFAESKQIEG